MSASTTTAKDAAAWSVKISEMSSRIVNPIRAVNELKASTTCDKPLLKLCIGDPTYDGNLLTPPEHVAAFQEACAARTYDGYAPVCGLPAARAAVAQHWAQCFTAEGPRREAITADHVVLTSGGSHAILLTLMALCNPGDNILIPAPGYPHYLTVCRTYGIEPRFYTLRPDKFWTACPEEIERLVDSRTRMLVMTNPSNPCGSNWSRAEVEAMVRTAERLRLPLFSDEIYSGLVFSTTAPEERRTFTSVADFDTTVPRVILGGTAKTFVVPGWRIGWLIFIDPANVAPEWFTGITNQALLFIGPCVPPQAALPAALLAPDAQAYIAANAAAIEAGAVAFRRALEQRARHSRTGAPLLSSTPAHGAMYVMVEIHPEAFAEECAATVLATLDRSFCLALLAEQNVLATPGDVFGAPRFFRVVVTRPIELLEEAVDRMVEFCHKYERKE